MARSRNIKPGFFLNDQLAECEPLARLLFAGLWCIADREGRLEDRPKRIKAEILPYDDCDVDKFLDDLQKHGFITRYEVEGESYIQIINFKKHQNPHVKEAASIIPSPLEQELTPEKHSASIVQEPEQHSTFPADSLNPHTDSLNPHTDSFKRIPDIDVAAGAAEYDSIPAEKPSGSEKTVEDGGAQSKQTGKDGYTQEFEEFWRHYPRKIEKKRAFRAWKARLKEGVKIEDLIQAAINYSQYCDNQKITEARYIKHGSTFLGPDKPYEEFITGPPEETNGDNVGTKEPKSWNALRTLYAEYEEQERGMGNDKDRDD
jgi:hypothetical protein